jgi:hypothetical protein
MTIYKQAGRTKEATELATRIRSLLEKEKADEDAGNRFRVVREDALSVVH